MTIYPSEAAAIALAIKTQRPLPAGLARKVVDFSAQIGLELGERRAAQRSLVAKAQQAQASSEKLTQAVNRLRDENALLRRQRDDAIESREQLQKQLEDARRERGSVLAFMNRFGGLPNGRTVDAIPRAVAAISRGDHLLPSENQGDQK